jgi:glutamate/tyrosine decarboxylase-like PLP-dependent enzyme
MRRLGHAAADLVTDRFVRIRERPVARRWTPTELERTLAGPVPSRGRDPQEVLRQVAEDILPACMATDHPRFFSYVPGPSNYVGAVADFLASGANVFAGHWLAGAGAAQVELVVLDWLRDLVGLPDTAGGILTSGGTQASLVALHAARVAKFGDVGATDARIYLTDQAHAAIVRGLAYLGFLPGQLRRVPSTDDLTMNVKALQEMIDADRAQGAVPWCVIATAGATSTGAVDPLDALAEVCARDGVWLHVDAAYGGAAVLTEKGRRQLQGLERADSIAVDPHKWWFQPYEAGCTLVRNAQVLHRAYTLHAEYLTEAKDAPINFYERGPQLTRGFRALKIWMTLQTFGLDAMRAAVEHGIATAEYAESVLRTRAHWRIATPAQLGIVTFRPDLPNLMPADVDRITRLVAEDTLDDGHALVFTTDLGAGPVLRLCTTHPETSKDDIDSTVEMLDRLLDRRQAELGIASAHTGSARRLPSAPS